MYNSGISLTWTTPFRLKIIGLLCSNPLESPSNTRCALGCPRYCANSIVSSITTQHEQPVVNACLEELLTLFEAVPTQWVAAPVTTMEDRIAGPVGQRSGLSLFNVCSRISVDVPESRDFVEQIFHTVFRKSYAFDDDIFSKYLHLVVTDQVGGSSEKLRVFLDAVTTDSNARYCWRQSCMSTYPGIQTTMGNAAPIHCCVRALKLKKQ